MSELKFETRVLNGKIEIPLKFRKKISGKIEVIIKAVKNKESDEPFDILTELLENPIKDPNFAPFTRDEIYDRKF
ncbi:hypothetical protein BH20ACI4_BH20ACI4_09760 [soil metagenome]